MKKKRGRYVLCTVLILIVITAVWASINTASSSGKEYFYANGKVRDIDGNIVKTLHFALFDIKGDLIAANNKGTASIRYWDESFFLETNYNAHHDLALTDEDTLLFLSTEQHIYKGRNITFDSIIELSFDGELINKWSTFENKEKLTPLHEASYLETPKVGAEGCSVWSELKQRRGCYEYYHFNSVNELPETKLGKKDKRFQAGNWIVSDRTFSLVFIIDKDTKEVVWTLDEKHNVRKQHDVKMLKSGNILIFDNGDYNFEDNKSYSRVVEYSPEKDEIVWQYGDKNSELLGSKSMSGAQRLPNGNTFITESLNGRLLEVTPDKKIVWEWINPDDDHHRLNNNVIYRAFKFPINYFEQQQAK